MTELNTAAANEAANAADVTVTTTTVPGPLGRLARKVWSTPGKIVLGTAALGVAGYFAYKHIRAGGNLEGAADALEATAEVLESAAKRFA